MTQTYQSDLFPDADHIGQRIDNYLLAKIKLPRSLIYKALRLKQIKVNNKKAAPSYRLEQHDVLQIPRHYLEQEQQSAPAPKNTSWIEECIHFENDDFYVINKPNGLAVHGGSGDSFGLIELLRHHYNNSKLELVHRLDKETSGLLLVTKKRSALVALSALFAERTIKKSYLAVVKGTLRKKIVIEQALEISRDHGIRKSYPDSQGQSAKTTFIPLQKSDQGTLCLAIPETGRMHQIRAHALFMHTPILGDKLYGQEDNNKLHLHAAKLEFSYKDQQWIFEVSPPLFWDQSLFSGWNLWKTINQLQS